MLRASTAVAVLITCPCSIPHVARVLRKRIRHWNPNVGLLALHVCSREAALARIAFANGTPDHRGAREELPSIPCPRRASRFRGCHAQGAVPQGGRALAGFVSSAVLNVPLVQKEKKTLLQHLQLQEQKVSEVSRLQRRDKILLLVESWARANKKPNDALEIYRITYEDLLRQGFTFPAPLKDEVSPVFTPAAKPRVLPETDTTGPVKDYGLQNDLATIELFMDVLNGTKPNENLTANDAVVSLKASLEASQQEIMNRIGQDPSEELMAELLIVNDEICQAMEFYEGIRSGKVKPKNKKVSQKKERPKGQRVSVFAKDPVDILGLNSTSPPPYESESEDESDDDDDENDSEAEVPQKAKQAPSSNKQSPSSNKSQPNEETSRELVLASKALAPPRSNAKSRNAQKAIMVDESNDAFKSSAQASSPSAEKDPFDVFSASAPVDANGHPLSAADALLSQLAIVPKKAPQQQQQQKSDLNVFDPV